MNPSAHFFFKSMLLVVGLGNPGPEYARTRHNVGFRVADRLAARCGLRWRQERFPGLVARGQVDGREIILLKPMTYMNRSGLAVASAAREFGLEPEEIVAVYDDLDLAPGRLRLRQQGSAGGHRGVASLIQALGTDRFNRVRIGIGRPAPGQTAADYVLEPFAPDEGEVLAPALEASQEAVLLALAEDFEAAMRKFN